MPIVFSIITREARLRLAKFISGGASEILKYAPGGALLQTWVVPEFDSGGPTPFAREIAFGPGGLLGARIDRENTRVCADGKSHLVGLGPVPGPERSVFFGDGKVFTRVRVTHAYVSSNSFFDTPSGELRLIIEKENSYWVQGKKTQPLLNLPLDENLHMIFTELGVYIGQPYGTPCDML